MTRVVGAAARIGVVALLIVSGVYVVLYLYRWEWNRALTAGIFFLASEIAVVGMVLSDRLREATHHPPPTVEDREPGRDGAQRFPWLDPSGGGLAVFVPVLIGAGVLLSLVAFVVERMARLTAPPGPSPTLRHLAGGHDAPVASSVDGGARPRRARRLLWVVALGGAVVVSAVALQALADVAQSRNEPPRAGWTTVYELEVRQRRSAVPVQRLAERLAVLCVPDTYGVEVRPIGGRRAELAVEPSPGRTEHRRVQGCLTDFQLDRVLAEVTSVSSAPTG